MQDRLTAFKVIDLSRAEIVSVSAEPGRILSFRIFSRHASNEFTDLLLLSFVGIESSTIRIVANPGFVGDIHCEGNAPNSSGAETGEATGRQRYFFSISLGPSKFDVVAEDFLYSRLQTYARAY